MLPRVTHDFEEIQRMLTPAGLDQLASAVLDFLEIMEDDRNVLRADLARALGSRRVQKKEQSDFFRDAARHDWFCPDAVLLALQQRKRPGPPKGRPLKIRVGGDWTPQALKAELARLGLSEAKLAKMLGINAKSVNKWSRTAIPDDRQEDITVVLKAYEEGLAQ